MNQRPHIFNQSTWEVVVRGAENRNQIILSVGHPNHLSGIAIFASPEMIDSPIYLISCEDNESCHYCQSEPDKVYFRWIENMWHPICQQCIFIQAVPQVVV